MKQKKEVYLFINNLEFLYKKFYDEFLLKMYTDAEKIVIYLTPFVLNVNLKVLMYEFNKDYKIQEKDFSEFLKDGEMEVILLYKGDHYDILYGAYIQHYLESMEFYKNNKERLRYITPNLLLTFNMVKKNKQSFNNNALDNINMISYTEDAFRSNY